MTAAARLRELFGTVLAAADPAGAVRRALRLSAGLLHLPATELRLADFTRILLVGAGKAATGMAAAVEEVLGDRLAGGVVLSGPGAGVPLRLTRRIEASHPVPGEAGLAGTREIMELARQAGEGTLLLCAISGGASSMLVAPAGDLTLDDKRAATRHLLTSGASIRELNAVRKHLSAVKGGRLARLAHPGTTVSLIVSDVVGDDPSVIASGPTAPDATTFADALGILDRFDPEGQIPAPVRDHLRRGEKGLETETARPSEPCFSRTTNIVVAGGPLSVEAAREAAVRSGYPAEILTVSLEGEARDAARHLAARARHVHAALAPGERRILLSCGETTVTVRGRGTGGRNQELALAFALEIEGEPGITLLSAGTDGIDGPTGGAGAIVDGSTAARGRESGLDPFAFLEENDSHTFFRRLDERYGRESLLVTGPTGTNVADVQLMLLEETGDGS